MWRVLFDSFVLRSSFLFSSFFVLRLLVRFVWFLLAFARLRKKCRFLVSVGFRRISHYCVCAYVCIVVGWMVSDCMVGLVGNQGNPNDGSLFLSHFLSHSLSLRMSQNSSNNE